VAESHQVMISGNARGRKVENAPNALVRKGAISDQIPRAQKGIDANTVENRQRRFHRMQIGVDIREDAVAHSAENDSPQLVVAAKRAGR
jgi:hypothetical protein